MFKVLKVAGVLGGLAIAAVALANAPIVNITAIGGVDATSGSVTLTIPLLPTTVNIDGTLEHDPNIQSLKSLTLSDNGTVFYTTNPSGLSNTATFTAPWTILTAGTHTILATATHGNSDGTDTVDVTVLLSGGVTVTQCPAAPAIAADYMHNTLGWKPTAGKFKTIMNLVAGETGSKGSLWAAHSCESWYAPATIAFVNSKI